MMGISFNPDPNEGDLSLATFGMYNLKRENGRIKLECEMVMRAAASSRFNGFGICKYLTLQNLKTGICWASDNYR